MKVTEENFIFNLRHKNEQALEYVLDNYGWIIKSIVKKHLYNLKDYQEDCINEILLGIWNNINSFDESRNNFKNWVAGISKYKAIDYQRKYLKDLENISINDLEIKAEDNSSNEITDKQLSLDLESMLNCLKDKDKELFIKLYVEQKEMDCIIKETGLKRDVIYNRMSRSKTKLRKLFSIFGNNKL